MMEDLERGNEKEKKKMYVTKKRYSAGNGVSVMFYSAPVRGGRGCRAVGGSAYWGVPKICIIFPLEAVRECFIRYTLYQ